MKFAFILLTLISYSAFACNVNLPHHLVILSDTADLHQAIEQTGCDSAIIQEVSQVLNGFEGRITSAQLGQILSTKNLAVNVTPAMIQVQKFKQIVRDQIMLPSGVDLRSSEAINSPNFLSLAPGDRIEVQCVGCLFGSRQPLNVNIYGFDGSIRTMTVRGDFKKMVKAYRLITFMPAFSDISKDVLKEEYVESIPHTNLVTNLDTLRFYKANKPIKAGDLLRQSDLNAVNLVRAGLKTEVVIENALVRIKTEGVSRSNGSLGETVEVFHPQKNKKYQGKVVDINKVLVEL